MLALGADFHSHIPPSLAYRRPRESGEYLTAQLMHSLLAFRLRSPTILKGYVNISGKLAHKGLTTLMRLPAFNLRVH